jgi:hypothetical protein
VKAVLALIRWRLQRINRLMAEIRAQAGIKRGERGREEV